MFDKMAFFHYINYPTLSWAQLNEFGYHELQKGIKIKIGFFYVK